jgi:integrase
VARTRRGTPPSYRRHSSGQACVTVRDATGRRREILLGPWDSPESKAEYARIISELAAHQGRLIEKRNDQAASSELTVNALILAFWKHAEQHYGVPKARSASTELLNLRDALRPLRALYGHTRACEFGPAALRTVREKMVETGLSRTTINARINRIRRVFRWGVSVELMPAPVIQALETVLGLQRGRSSAKEPAEIKPVPIERVEATLPHLNRVVAAMVRIQFLTGCRAEEIMIMRGCDLTPGELNWEYRPAWHKTAWRGKDRVIILGPKAQAIVRQFLKADLQAFLFDPRDVVEAHHAERARKRKSRPAPSEFARRIKASPGRGRADHYDRRTYRQAVIRACDRAFLHPVLSKIKRKELTAHQRRELKEWRRTQRWSPLRLRHTAATTIRSRFGLEASQVILGHAKADVTQLYAERDLAKAHSIMAEIG